MKRSVVVLLLLLAVASPVIVQAAPPQVEHAAKIVAGSQSAQAMQPFSVQCVRQAEAMFRWHAYSNKLSQASSYMVADAVGLQMNDSGGAYGRILWNGDMVLSRAKGPDGGELPPKVYPWGSWCKPVGK